MEYIYMYQEVLILDFKFSNVVILTVVRDEV